MAEKLTVLFQGEGEDSDTFIVGEGDLVRVVVPSCRSVGPPVHRGSVANHMPYAKWKPFAGDPAPIVALVEQARAEK